jgi:predicted nucleotidyltransferase
MRSAAESYPGTPQHQAVLRAIVAHYREDPRVLSVIVFGSLGRGNWDSLSDLDLDIVIADGVEIDPAEELRRLCDSLAVTGERVALIIPDGEDAGDALLESLLRLSVRFHPLAATSPSVVDSMRVLAGRIDPAAIVAAGLANRRPGGESPAHLLERCLWYASEASVYLQREQTWLAIELLHRLRRLLIELYAVSRDQQRALHAFEEAEEALQARLGQTLPQCDPASLRRSLERCLDILEQDVEEWTGGAAALTEPQRRVLARIRRRQVSLDADAGVCPSGAA